MRKPVIHEIDGKVGLGIGRRYGGSNDILAIYNRSPRIGSNVLLVAKHDAVNRVGEEGGNLELVWK